ncbi:MAG: PAS domain S-box protein [Chloroflexi bacterium]|nr:PAS domain S-box protein [Chloroflexota bacterium]
MSREQLLNHLAGIPTATDGAYKQPVSPLFPAASTEHLRKWSLKYLWRFLTEPILNGNDFSLYRQRRLLSSVLLLLVLAGIFLGILPYVIYNIEPDHFFYMVSASVETLAFLYLLSRSKHYTVAATLTVVFLSVATFFAAAPKDTPPDPMLLVYLVIPVILSSILLSTWATMILLVSQVGGMIAFQEYFGLSSNDSWTGFVILISALVVMATHHWRMIERERQAVFATERNLLRTVIDHVPDYVYVKDTQTRFVFQNKTVIRMLGAQVFEQMIGRTDFDFFPVEYASLYQSDDYEVIRSGTALVNQEEPSVDAEGRLRWLLTTKVPLRDNNGQIIGLVGIGRDITERKQAEDELAHYNQRLDLLHALDQNVLAGLPLEEIGQRAMQQMAQLLPCDQTYLALINSPSQEVEQSGGKPATQSHPGDSYPLIKRIPGWTNGEMKQVLIKDTAETDQDIPVWLLAKGIRTYLNTPLVAEDQVIGELWMGAATPDAFDDKHCQIAVEIADQLAIAFHHTTMREQIQRHTADLEKRVEQRTAELNRAMDRVEAILNNSSDGIILAYVDGTITQTNPTFDRLLGYQPDALFHQCLTSIVAPDYAAVLAETLAAVTQDGEIRQIEALAYRSDGSTFCVEIGLSLIKGGDNYRSSIVCNLRDITERKRVEKELRNALEKEKELNELKSRFVSMVSHEFRTPLTTISSSNDLLKSYIDRMSAEQKNNHFVRIEAAIRHMIQLLEDVLFFGKAEAQRVTANPTLLDLGKLCQEALDTSRIGADSKLEFVFTSSGQTDKVLLDEKMVKLILFNLLSNAIKYSPDGGTVRLELHCTEEHAIIRVSDQGIGISKKDQERLGEPFYRADNVASIKGTGMGLTIVQRALELQGGNLRIESELGYGTTMTATLPAHVSSENNAVENAV